MNPSLDTDAPAMGETTMSNLPTRLTARRRLPVSIGCDGNRADAGTACPSHTKADGAEKLAVHGRCVKIRHTSSCSSADILDVRFGSATVLLLLFEPTLQKCGRRPVYRE